MVARVVTYTVLYGQLKTGKVTAALPVASASFGDELRQVGSFQAQVAQGQCGNGSLWQAVRAAYSFWAVEWADDGGRQIVAGGPIFSTDPDDSGITYGGSGMFGMMSHRKLINQSWTDAQISTASLTFGNLDLGSIIAEIVQTVTNEPNAALPIVYEPLRSGSNTRTYQGYDLLWASDKISEIGSVESGTGGLGGPDWLFMPRYKAGDFTSVEWVLTTGTAANPTLTQTGSPVVLDRGANNQQNVGPVSTKVDGAKLSTTAFNSGGGSQGGKTIRSASDPTLTAAGYPRMDGESQSNANDAATVTAYAQGLLTRTKRPPAATTVEVRASWWWAQGGGTGVTVRLLDPSHPVFGAIDLTSRAIKWDVSDIASEWVSLTLADSIVSL